VLLGLLRVLLRSSIASIKGVAVGALIVYALLPSLLNAYELAVRRIPNGESYSMDSREKGKLIKFITDHTPSDAVIASGLAPYLAWNAGRTIMQYSGHPSYRVQANAMWEAIDRQIPIDYILYSDYAAETAETPVPPSFRLVCDESDGRHRFLLYQRQGPIKAMN
jgi:hypothetical protein